MSVRPKSVYSYTINKFAKKGYKNRKDAWYGQSTIFYSGKRSLLFIGAEHTYGTNNLFLNFLKKEFKRFAPDYVLIEISKDLDNKILLSTLQKIKHRWNERDWTIYLAEKYKISIDGMDAKMHNMFKPFLNSKYGIELGILHWFILYYTEEKRGQIGQELKNQKDIYEFSKFRLLQGFFYDLGFLNSFKKDLISLKNRKYKSYSYLEMMDLIIKKMAKEYISNKPVLWLLENERALEAPYGTWSESRKYEINKVNAYLSSYRNASMINECIDKLKHHNRVFAIAGSGHIDLVRDILAKEIKKELVSVR